jgi:hypothetical protein
MPPQPAAAVEDWQVTRSPASVEAGDTVTIVVTATNTGGGAPSEEIRCVSIRVPGAFHLVSTSIVADPPGGPWEVSSSGSTVEASAVQGSAGGRPVQRPGPDRDPGDGDERG